KIGNENTIKKQLCRIIYRTVRVSVFIRSRLWCRGFFRCCENAVRQHTVGMLRMRTECEVVREECDCRVVQLLSERKGLRLCALMARPPSRDVEIVSPFHACQHFRSFRYRRDP